MAVAVVDFSRAGDDWTGGPPVGRVGVDMEPSEAGGCVNTGRSEDCRCLLAATGATGFDGAVLATAGTAATFTAGQAAACCCSL